MRDLIDKLLILSESTGLAGRKAGDIFRNPEGDEIVFNNIQFFPTGGGKLDSQSLDKAISDIEKQTGEIQWQNIRTAKSGGFALASFSNKDNEFFVGRYLEQVKPDITDNYIPNQVGTYKLASKAAVKAQSGLSPQDLLKDKIDLSVPDIMNQLAESLGTDSILYYVAHKIAVGEPLPITFPAPKDVSFSAFRDYFCEILQPIGLQKGQYTGNAGEAAEIFLGGSLENTLISFDDSKTAGLSDSIMTMEDGRFVKVSSKGGKGATASSKNLLNSIDELEGTKEGKKLLSKYKDIIDLLREVQSQGQAGAPLYLGVKFNIIDEKDKDQIVKLKNYPPIDMKNINSLKLSKNLVKLAMSRVPDTPSKVNLYYHLMAVVAHKAAEKVNSETNFSSAAAEILNNGALVQVYTKARQGKDNWTLDEFQTVYPGKTIQGVYFSAGKTYYSTGIKGNFTFKIDKGQGDKTDKEAETLDPTDDDFIDKATDISLGRKTSTDKKPSKIGDVGRQKRK
jgi:hypothetical protein